MFNYTDKDDELDAKRLVLWEVVLNYNDKQTAFFNYAAISVLVLCAGIWATLSESEWFGSATTAPLIALLSLLVSIPLISIWLVYRYEGRRFDKLEQLLLTEVLERDDPVEAPLDNVTDAAESDNDESVTKQAEALLFVKSQREIGIMFAEDLLTATDDEKADAERRVMNSRMKAAETALTITDPFYHYSALHFIIELLMKCSEQEQAAAIFKAVDDDFFREQIIEACPELTTI